MTYNMMTPESRFEYLKTQFEDLGLGWADAVLCVGVFVGQTILMLPKTPENEKQIQYWEEVKEHLNEY